MEKHLRIWLALAIVLCLAVPAFAQETQGGIQGTVKDPAGAVISGATVEVTGPALIGKKTLTTDSGGYYRVTGLAPGSYDVKIMAKGFADLRQTGVKIEAGGLPTLTSNMSVGANETVIDVAAQGEIVDVTQSKVQTNVTSEIINNMPRGRSFQSVIPFAPGARQEPMQSRRDDAGRTNGFQIDGASDSENVYLVEGMNTTNLQDGGVGRNVPMEFLQEVQIKSSSFEAEFGGAIGGVINVIQRRGSNNWHGSAFTYFRTNELNANDQCQAPGLLITQCGLRTVPGTSNSTATRTSAPFEYYLQQKDDRRILDPGFEIGGPIFKDKLWLFASYVPTFDVTERTVNFTGAANAGLRTLERRDSTHNAMGRLDWAPFQSVRVFGSWQYGLNRVQGALPLPDSTLPVTPTCSVAQCNTNAGNDPATTYRADSGSINPSQLFNTGVDWTITPHLVATGRYGYFFTNTRALGVSTGVRYLFQTASTGSPTVLGGATFPVAFQKNAGFSNIGNNFGTLFDAYKRRSINADLAYFKGNFGGTHNFKVGYSLMRQQNDVLSGFKTARVDFYAGQNYSVQTSSTACNAIIAANQGTYGVSPATQGCRGQYGYFIVTDGVDVVGNVSADSHAFYVQDAWTVGRTGLTINAGVRFEKEFVPPYRAGADSVDFGFGDKIAPRIGAAYDVLHNGKLKIYGSYGKFFDIMKLGLPRGSFGGDYWHDCAYAWDNPDYTTVTPTAPNGHGCETTGSAPGVGVGRFIENQDWRKNHLNPLDPGLDPNIKPMEQHEFVGGADWAINSQLGFELRYARKRLDRAIEDIGATDNLGFYIGNPGSNTYADLLHRPLLDSGITVPLCAACPAQPEAIRNYDGLEFRLTKRPSKRWFGSMSYTYSRLNGNYSGLTATDVTDGNGGRHSPANHRSFDSPVMQFDSHGKIIDGPLATDRPHALKLFGFYNLDWLGMETVLGFDQSIFSGSPVGTCVPVFGSASSCMFVEGRDGFVELSRAANGDIVAGNVRKGNRSPAYSQTDFNFSHAFKVSKTNENMRIRLEMNVSNLLNQRAPVAYNLNPFIAGGITGPAQAVTAANPTGLDFLKVMTGWDWVATANSLSLAQGGTSVNGKMVLDSRYGQPNFFQQGRQLRFKVEFRF